MSPLGPSALLADIPVLAEIVLCTACRRPIDVSRRHVTLSLSVERQDDDGNIHYGGVRVLGRWHPLHAVWEPSPDDRRYGR